MEVLLERTLTGFKPHDLAAVADLRGLKLGAIVRAEIVRPRDLVRHRKFFALLTTVWQAAGDWSSVEDLLNELKLRIGHTRKHKLDKALKWSIVGDGGEILTTITIPKGTIVESPDSISFANMDQTAFDRFYERALKELCAMAGGIDDGVLRETVLNELVKA